MTEEYLRPNEVEKICKITSRTIYNWERSGKIKCVRTKGGQRRFLKSEIFSLIEGGDDSTESSPQPKKETNRERICYCRVSTRSQKEDLERQITFFRTHEKYRNYKIVKDYGSGLNSKRKGFNSILDQAIKGNIEEIVITHKDRFCRFNFEIFERIVTDFSNGRIVVLNQDVTSPEKEIIDDLISIVTVYSSRIYGLRSNSIKKKIQQCGTKTENIEDKDLSIST